MNWRSNPSISFWPQSWRYPWPLVSYHETANCRFYRLWMWQVKFWKKGKQPTGGPR